ncbi:MULTISPECIES: WxL domain-containing protein [Vagococcus]|uniref:WxL domain-containing protein n=1 Tax=Vagococcus fluvialis bH819 TaxID=1255619 RepID=A0A1X6WLY5_9ENTE|nr:MULTISPECIES: WxL domain-containing protein [Vagococcus]SLM85344.1 hypothetical protein FM121_04550 [Vagococcus fluvialis bH819]HCM89362.1 WxL domain-containing protein [Vagococcus sp.]
MKKNHAILALGLCLISATLVGTKTFAASGETNGKVEFEKPKDPNINGPFNIIKPGTYNQWITIPKSEGSITVDGEFGFSFVPNLNFGKVRISTKDERHNLNQPIKYQDYTEGKDFDAEDGRKIKYLPPFLQVINLRGTKEAYQVSVTASKFASAEAGVGELTNTRIELKDFSLRNNLLDKTTESDANSIFNTPVGEVDNQGYVSLIPDQKVSLMNTKEGKGSDSDGSSSSLVFAENYKNDKAYDQFFNTDSEASAYESIRLFVPSSDMPQPKKEYSATLKWELGNVQ